MVEFKGHVHNAHHFRHRESKFRVFFDVSIPPRVRSPIESPVRSYDVSRYHRKQKTMGEKEKEQEFSEFKRENE